ncbi:MAG TPA: hypothetical protein VKD19_13935 [Pseudolabrys sp.]|nr:hypothetical protein [Pseudolabrys sp.]
MHKVFIIALGLSTLGALASMQSAFAVTKTICQRHLISSPKNCSGKANCTITNAYGGMGTKECYTIDVGPAPTAWKGNSASATKTYSPSTAARAK